MDFSRKKLPIEIQQSLFQAKIDTIKPFALMLAPVYLLLSENQKFVSVKAPLDFFAPHELKRLQRYENFYFPQFVSHALPFRVAGQRVRSTLELAGQDFIVLPSGTSAVALVPAPYEVSDSLLRLMGPLWWEYPGHRLGVEPFFVTVFVNEVCDLLPPEELIEARESHVDRFDLALLRSSWAVFLALLAGYSDLTFVNALRNRVFQENLKKDPELLYDTEMDELIAFSTKSLTTRDLKILTADIFDTAKGKVSQKIANRLERVKKEFVSTGEMPPSIFGVKGFVDV